MNIKNLVIVMALLVISSCSKVTITAHGGVQLHEGPGFRSRTINVVGREGTKVDVLREVDGYAQIRFDSNTGWVCAGSLSTSHGHSDLRATLQRGACTSYFPCGGCPLDADSWYTGYQLFPDGRASFGEPNGYVARGQWTVLDSTITVTYSVNRRLSCRAACRFDNIGNDADNPEPITPRCLRECEALDGDKQITTRLREHSDGSFQIDDESYRRLAPLEFPE